MSSKVRVLLMMSLPLLLMCPESFGADQPNVIVINVDNHAKWSLSFFGNKFIETPNIDRLIGGGIRFRNYHASGRCTSSRSALLTGRYHARNGALGTGSAWGGTVEGVTTMGHVFSENGYRTAMFGKWHIGDTYPLRPEDRGFQEVVTIHNGGTLHQVVTKPGYNGSAKTGAAFRFRHNGVWKEYEGWRTDTWFNELNRYLEEGRNATKPFFVYLATVTEHGPHYGPEDLQAKYKQKYESDEWKQFRQEREATLAEGLKKKIGKKEKTSINYPYDHAADIAGLDRNVGRLLDKLDELRLADNTIVVYTSDGSGGGTAGCDRSDEFGPSSIPFALRWPAINTAAKKPRSELIATIDVLPTLANICGIKLSETYLDSIDGQDFGQLLGIESAASWKPRVYVEDHQSSSGKKDINDQMVMRPHASTTVYLSDGRVASWKEMTLGKKLPPELLKEAEAAYRAWMKRVVEVFPLGAFAMVGDGKGIPVYPGGYPILDGPAGEGIKTYFALDVGSDGAYELNGNTDDRYGGEAKQNSPRQVTVVLSRKNKSGRLPVEFDPPVRGYRVTSKTLKESFDTIEKALSLPGPIQLEKGRYLIHIESRGGKRTRSLRVEKQ